MAFEIAYDGPVTVTFDTVAQGYSRDGCTVRIQPFWNDVKADYSGGEQGPPADTQFLGAIATVNCDLTKYELATVERLASTFDYGLTEGKVPLPGTLMRQEAKMKQLKLLGTKFTTTFETAFVRQATEFNAGVRAKFFRLSFECWMADYSATRILMTLVPTP